MHSCNPKILAWVGRGLNPATGIGPGTPRGHNSGKATDKEGCIGQPSSGIVGQLRKWPPIGVHCVMPTYLWEGISVTDRRGLDFFFFYFHQARWCRWDLLSAGIGQALMALLANSSGPGVGCRLEGENLRLYLLHRSGHNLSTVQESVCGAWDMAADEELAFHFSLVVGIGCFCHQIKWLRESSQGHCILIPGKKKCCEPQASVGKGVGE